MNERAIQYLWIKSEYGAGTTGSSLGPDAVKLAAYDQGDNLFHEFPAEEIAEADAMLKKPVDKTLKKGAWHIKEIRDIYPRIAQLVADTIAAEKFPFILSGDHSNAGGTIAGLKKARPDKRLGVIWIDAHCDLHTPLTSPSGNMHGMPLASALGFDNAESQVREPLPETISLWRELCDVGGVNPKIRPEDLVFIGIRSYEQPEADLLERHNIKYYDPAAIKDKPVLEIAKETLAYLSGCDYLYVSFDIDSMDKSLAPGTGTPVENGLDESQARALLNFFWASPKLAAFELTEVNPLLDEKNRTAELALSLIRPLLQANA